MVAFPQKFLYFRNIVCFNTTGLLQEFVICHHAIQSYENRIRSHLLKSFINDFHHHLFCKLFDLFMQERLLGQVLLMLF